MVIDSEHHEIRAELGRSPAFQNVQARGARISASELIHPRPCSDLRELERVSCTKFLAPRWSSHSSS